MKLRYTAPLVFALGFFPSAFIGYPVLDKDSITLQHEHSHIFVDRDIEAEKHMRSRAVTFQNELRTSNVTISISKTQKIILPPRAQVLLVRTSEGIAVSESIY